MATVKEQGIMDIGKHCSVCHRLDFLPYTCPKCGKVFCGDHRAQFNEHSCVVELTRRNSNRVESIDTSRLPSAKTLFPNMERLRERANEKAKKEHAQTVGQRLGGSMSASVKTALDRLTKMMERNKKKKGTKSRSLLSFGSSSSKSRFVETAKLRKAAVGDCKVATPQRVYVWCLYVGEDKVTDRKAVWASKAWPVGRMLDNCSETLKIRNVNNRVTDKAQRLEVFREARKGEEGYVHVPTGSRVAKEVQDGDTIYIVRGDQM